MKLEQPADGAAEAHVRRGLEDLASLAEAMIPLAPRVASFARRYADTLQAGGTLCFVGNGGSAADAQHLATEYVVRYRAMRRPFAALALTTDSSLLTAAGNDLGFEELFARQIEALCRPRDLIVIHSTSGRSPNLLRAASVARDRGIPVVAFLGAGGGPLLPLVDDAIVVPSEETSHVQEVQLALEHLIVELVEKLLAH